MKEITQMQKMVNSKMKYPFFFMLLFLCYACKDEDSGGDYDPNAPVVVTSVIPETGTISLPLVIHGQNFGTDRSKIKVYFDDVQAPIITVKNEHLYVLSPRQEGGQHTVKVVVDGKEGVLKDKLFTYTVTSSVSTVAGLGEEGAADGSALEATFFYPSYLAVDNKNNMIVSDGKYASLRLISLNDNKVTTLLDDNNECCGPCFSSDYSRCYVTTTKEGYLVHEFFPASNWGYESILNDPDSYEDYPCDITMDEEGTLYVIGYYGGFAKKTVGSPSFVTIGDITDRFKSTASMPMYITYNPMDKCIYGTNKNNIIYRFDSRKEKLTADDYEVYAGIEKVTGMTNGERSSSTFNSPRGLAFDSKGDLYVGDAGNNVIRKITKDGIASTLTGQLAGGHKDGALEDALFSYPSGIAISPEDFIYVSDMYNHRIRCIAIQ